jgi:CMP-N-acetylneuraminic acid synthetase
VVTLTPATPLTRPDTLTRAFERIVAHPEWDAVTTVRKAAEHPEWMLSLDERSGEAKTILGNPLDGEYNVSQNLKPVYYPTGAFWINRVQPFLGRPSLYGETWGAVIIDPKDTVDIDWPEDLARAASLLRSMSNEDLSR